MAPGWSGGHRALRERALTTGLTLGLPHHGRPGGQCLRHRGHHLLRERGLTSPRRLVRGTILSGGIAARRCWGRSTSAWAVLGTRTRGQITTDTKDGTELLRNAASTRGPPASSSSPPSSSSILACLTTAVGLLASWAMRLAWPPSFAVSAQLAVAACAIVSFTWPLPTWD